jgi:transcriptional regulator with XRE-family HTH domain
MEYRDIGENIRKYRNRLDLTQDQLADRVGVTWEMISRYERGESSPLNKLDKIAEALGISLTDLIDDTLGTNYEIPLFTEIPKNFIFNTENTTLFYNCPKWLIKRDPESFAIDSKLVNSKVIDIKQGYIFVSPNSKIGQTDLMLIANDGQLIIEEFKHNGYEPIGKIMMQEILFI